MNLTPEVLREWVEGSGVDDAIVRLNVEWLEGYAPFERLFYSDKIKRLNTGRLPSWILKRYAHLEQGGWWCSGVDPITGDDDLWGCFKPVRPRIDPIKGRIQKYEHPYKASSTAFFLRIPWGIGLRIAARNGVANEYRQRLLKAYKYSAVQEPDEEFLKTEDKSFWQWVLENPKVDITCTEGAKKTASLLSQGVAAIGLPGIWGAYRKNDGKPALIPQLEPFTSGDRQFYFAFDQDEKRSTRQNNRKALWHTAKLLRDKGCEVKIVQWEPWIKGVDDLIVTKGGIHFVECYAKALPFQDWMADGLRELTYKPALRLDSNTKYIGDFSPPPSAKLICIKAPKNSGKTEWLVKRCAEAQRNGQKVLVATHRTQLGEALCKRFGIDYVTEMQDSDTKGVFGYGLCFDSLRRNSQARFNPDDWEGGIVILDECEQSIWHLLNARTEVASHRVAVLRNCQQLIQNTLESDEGKVYLSDADLSDLSVDYVRSLTDFPVEPWIAVKEGNPSPWNVTVWDTCNELAGALVSHIRQGGIPLVFVDGQKAKSKWGTQNLESYLAKLFPDKRILRIDSETIANPNHPAFGCMSKLDEILKNYDIVIASPAIETGVSIDLKGHFTSVWDIAQGVIPVSSVLQRMARLREPVPRHIWAKSYGMGRIGNGSASPKALMASQQAKFKAHVKLLVESEFTLDLEPASNFQPQALRTWAKMAARINLGMVRYRHEILRALVREGHSISSGDYLEVFNSDDEAQGTDQIKEDLTESRDKIYQEHCYAVSQAPNPDDNQHNNLNKKKSRTAEELQQLRKGELSRRYSEELVSSELVELDDKGEYSKARLHYYLTVGRERLGDRDKQVAEKMLESGQGELFLPDVNRSLIGGQIRYLEVLGIKQLLQQDTEWTNESQVLIDLTIKARQFDKAIKNVLGVSIKENDTPIAIGQKFLRQCMGLAFSTPIKRGSRENQQRYYQPVEVPELRQKIFSVWLQRDETAKAAKLAQQSADSPLDASPSSISVGGLGSDGNTEQLQNVVGTSGNIYSIPVVPTGSAAYQSAAYGLVERLAAVATREEFWEAIAGCPGEAVEDAIAMQDGQPRRKQLSRWLSATAAAVNSSCDAIASHSDETPRCEIEAIASQPEKALEVGDRVRVKEVLLGGRASLARGLEGVVQAVSALGRLTVQGAEFGIEFCARSEVEFVASG